MSDPRNLAMAMATVVVWALAFPVIAVALREVPPITLAFVRFAIASAFFMGLQFTIGGGVAAIRALDGRSWAMVIAFGIIQSGVSNIAQNIGMQWTGAGVAAIIQSVGPVFAVALAIAFLGEGLTRTKVAGGVLAIAGTMGIVTGGGEPIGASTLVGNALMVVTAAAYATGGTLAKHVLRRVDPATLMAVGTPFSLVPLGILASLEEGALGSLRDASATAWASIAFLGLVATAVTMSMWYRVLARVELSHLVYFFYLIPVFSVAFSWVILGETITFLQVLFGAVIIAGVALAQSERPAAAAAVMGVADGTEPGGSGGGEG